MRSDINDNNKNNKLHKSINQQTRCQAAYSCSKCNTLGSLTASVIDIATHCSADRPVGRPQRIPHRCTPLRGTGLQPQEFCRGFCLVRALSQLSWLEPSHSSRTTISISLKHGSALNTRNDFIHSILNV